MKKLIFLATFAMAGIAQAHGLHFPVEPRYHVMVHVLQFVVVAVLAISLGVYAVRRGRDASK